ncbi:hypothetical protein [Boudabousia marimammalium]|uniref:SH3b domain-containing protein n=1 Tax=Boudabousia marimammalium TaxID=156892 RepID=A0A1Q5PJ83_9ACTO|nr:hypothetical protein [Boudabousia marimammalium]OKL45910.1 hypothetical protein BM477_07850 [Boudabousia marimammalium]
MRTKYLQRILVAVAISTLATVSIGGVSLAHAATNGTYRSACELYSYRPTISGSTITGVGGRHGCSNSVKWVEVSLWRDNWVKDTLLAKRSKGWVNTIQLSVQSSTGQAGSGAYVYTYTKSATGATKSSSNIQL